MLLIVSARLGGLSATRMTSVATKPWDALKAQKQHKLYSYWRPHKYASQDP